MTGQFTVIDNPAVVPAPTPAATTAPVRGVESDVRALLRGRQFHLLGVDYVGAAAELDTADGGGFIAGAHAPARARALRGAHPGVPFIVEPTALRRRVASADAPFALDAELKTGLRPNLNTALDLQRADGSDAAMTPTGQIKVGDLETLHAVVRAANQLDRDDLIVALPVSAGWLSDEPLRHALVRTIDASRHPVAVTLVANADPLGSLKRLRAYRRLFAECHGTLVAYRTDLAGFDARAHGAAASVIGAYPSTRRLTPAGARGSSQDPDVMRPHLLVTDLLRFVRTALMNERWFAEAEPFVCLCRVCRGGAIDRLHGDVGDRAIGHLHNVVAVQALHRTTTGVPDGALGSLWRAQVHGALDAHLQLVSHVGAPIPTPANLRVWAEPL